MCLSLPSALRASDPDQGLPLLLQVQDGVQGRRAQTVSQHQEEVSLFQALLLDSHPAVLICDWMDSCVCVEPDRYIGGRILSVDITHFPNYRHRHL